MLTYCITDGDRYEYTAAQYFTINTSDYPGNVWNLLQASTSYHVFRHFYNIPRTFKKKCLSFTCVTDAIEWLSTAVLTKEVRMYVPAIYRDIILGDEWYVKKWISSYGPNRLYFTPKDDSLIQAGGKEVCLNYLKSLFAREIHWQDFSYRIGVSGCFWMEDYSDKCNGNTISIVVERASVRVAQVEVLPDKDYRISLY